MNKTLNLILIGLILIVVVSLGQQKLSLANEKSSSLEEFKETVEKQANLFKNSFFLSGETTEKVIALTFDDGPDLLNTPLVLEILAEAEVKATFFLLGENVAKYPDLTKLIVEKGHQVANHSWTHTDFRNLENETIIEQELLPTSELIAELTGIFPKVLRPPYGAISRHTIEFLGAKGWKIVNWSIDTFDWDSRQNTPVEIIEKVERHNHPGGIILMHNSRVSTMTVKALPRLIELLKDKGYEFLTINELLF